MRTPHQTTGWTSKNPGPGPNPAATARPSAFAAVWFGLTVVLSLAAISVQARTSIVDADVLSIVMLAPAVAAGITWIFWRGWAPPPTARASRRRQLSALALAAAWGVVFYAVLALLDGTAGHLPRTVGGVPVLVMVALQLVGALGEEIGYRGVLLRAMESSLPRWTAAAANGLVFGAIHTDYWSQGPAAVLVFITGTVGLVVAMVAIRTGSFWQRIFTTSVIHFCANIAMFVVTGSDITMWRFAVATWIAAAVALAVRHDVRPAPYEAACSGPGRRG